MKRASYVDKQGNPIDYNFQNKKPLLNFFFFVGTIIPLIIIGFMIYQMIENNTCNKVNESIKKASLEYLKDNDKKPLIEGEFVKVSVDKLYYDKYISKLRTNNKTCSGTVKVTKYKNEYIYTLNLTNCNQCTTSEKYGSWSKESNFYPKNKAIIDVTAYYNYYERQISYTEWSKYYEQDEINKNKKAYGINMPTDDRYLPKVPEEGEVVEAQKEDKLYYRYQDIVWRWYDIVGDYSDYSSEKPSGYANKDNSTIIYTEWSDYSLDYPEEKSYRNIESITGYKFYYTENGKKKYANNGKYTPEKEVDTTKYTERDDQNSKLYRYRDEMWRWYNGGRRRYSNYTSTKPSSYNYKDNESQSITSFTNWREESSLNTSNISYRTEETKTVTRFRYIYEILSLPVLNIPITKEEFIKKTDMLVSEFITLENYKLEISYKFRYRKS